MFPLSMMKWGAVVVSVVLVLSACGDSEPSTEDVCADLETGSWSSLQDLDVPDDFDGPDDYFKSDLHYVGETMSDTGDGYGVGLSTPSRVEGGLISSFDRAWEQCADVAGFPTDGENYDRRIGELKAQVEELFRFM